MDTHGHEQQLILTPSPIGRASLSVDQIAQLPAPKLESTTCQQKHGSSTSTTHTAALCLPSRPAWPVYHEDPKKELYVCCVDAHTFHKLLYTTRSPHMSKSSKDIS